MCLAIPVRIERLLGGRRAVASQSGTEVEIDVSLIRDPAPGDSVIVHAGYAIEKLSPRDAAERAALFERLADAAGEPGDR
jgi:hydrogenase expression/formation protein HypC